MGFVGRSGKMIEIGDQLGFKGRDSLRYFEIGTIMDVESADKRLRPAGIGK